MSKLKRLITILSIAVLSACGGGGNSSDEELKVIENGVPDADVAVAQANVKVGTEVVLDASASSDPDNDKLTFSWTLSKPEGSEATLSSTTEEKPTLTPDLPGDYIVTINVSDGVAEDSSSLTIVATDIDQNAIPEANISGAPTGEVKVGKTINLSGAGSKDADGDSLTYEWVLTAPSGSNANFDDSTAVSPSFTPDQKGSYTISLQVSDAAATSSLVSVSISVAENIAPLVSVSGPSSAKVGDTVTFTAGVTDADDESFTYSWKVFFGDATVQTSSDTSISFGVDTAGDYAVTVSISDVVNTVTETATVQVTELSQNVAPVAKIQGVPASPVVGHAITLDGSGSTDTDQDTLAYSWTLEVPMGSKSALDNSTAVKPTFTPDTDGSYVVSLTVDDSKGGTDTDSVTIQVAANNSPSVSLSGPTSAKVREALQYVVTASDNEDTLQIDWYVYPTEGTVSSQSPSGDAFDFTADAAGAYTVTVSVSDGVNAPVEESLSVQITEVDQNGAPVAKIGNARPYYIVGEHSQILSESTDPDNDSLSFEWTLTFPDGSKMTETNIDVIPLTFNNVGSYNLSLTVSDGQSSSTTEKLLKVEDLFNFLILEKTVHGNSMTYHFSNDGTFKMAGYFVDAPTKSDWTYGQSIRPYLEGTFEKIGDFAVKLTSGSSTFELTFSKKIEDSTFELEEQLFNDQISEFYILSQVPDLVGKTVKSAFEQIADYHMFSTDSTGTYYHAENGMFYDFTWSIIKDDLGSYVNVDFGGDGPSDKLFFFDNQTYLVELGQDGTASGSITIQ